MMRRALGISFHFTQKEFRALACDRSVLVFFFRTDRKRVILSRPFPGFAVGVDLPQVDLMNFRVNMLGFLIAERTIKIILNRNKPNSQNIHSCKVA